MESLSAIAGILGIIKDPCVALVKHLHDTRKQEKSDIDDLWRDVVRTLATKHPLHQYIKTHDEVDFYTNEVKSTKFGKKTWGKSWTICEGEENNTEYRVSLLILALISQNLKSRQAVESLVSSVLGKCGFPLWSSPTYEARLNRAKTLFRRKVLKQIAKDIWKLPPSVITAVEKSYERGFTDPNWKERSDTHFLDLKTGLEAEGKAEGQHWKSVAIPGCQVSIAYGLVNNDAYVGRILVPDNKETERVLWALSGRLRIGHTLNRKEEIKNCSFCASNEDGPDRMADWHALLPRS